MRIVTVQHALPSREVTNDDLIERFLEHADGDLTDGRRSRLDRALRGFLARAGAERRFHRAPGERAIEFGLAAGRRALAAAEVGPKDVDLLIYVGVGRGFLEPATATAFQSLLGLSRATCFDILDACASWLRALDVARHLIHGGAARRVMILNCEFNFEEYIRWDLRSPSDLQRLGAGFTVGEAATATLLERGEGADDDYHAVFHTQGEHHDLCQIPLPHAAQFQLDGGEGGDPGVPMRFYAVAADLHAAALDGLERLYWSDPRFCGKSWDLVFGHSTSVPASREILARLRIDPERAVDLFPRFGNTVSASVPLALSIALGEGRLRRGQSLLIIMGSAGLTVGFCGLRC